MAQPGDIIYRRGVPFVVLPNGSLAPASGQSIGEETATGKVLTGNYVGTGQMGAIGGVLGVTGPTTSPAGKAAIDRLQNQKDREACNASGGFYTLGGACLTGQEAEDRVNEIMNNPDAPANNKQAAEAWLERNASESEDQIEDGINVSDLVRTHGQATVDAIFDKAGEAVDIIKSTAADPQAAIDKFISTYGTRAKTGTGSWKDWTEVGIFGGIAGIPLPPGFIGGTVRELEDKIKEAGATIAGVFSDPAGTLGKIGTWVNETVEKVLDGTADSPWGTTTVGAVGDWVKGVLGPTLGSTIISTTASSVDKAIQDSILNVGGEAEEEDTTQTAKQGDDIADPLGSGTAVERDPDDIFTDTTADNTNREINVRDNGGFTYVDPFKDDTTGNVIGAGYFYGEDDDDVDVGGTTTTTTPTTTPTTTTPTTTTTTTPTNTTTTTPTNTTTTTPTNTTTTVTDNGSDSVTIGGTDSDQPPTNTVITGDSVDIDEDPDDPDEIGGPPKSSGGGGGGGGGGGMFEPQSVGLPGMGNPALLAAQEFPIVNFLSEILAEQTKDELMSGMLTGRSIV